MPGESSAVPTEDRVGLNHLQTSPPTGQASVQHNPQEPVATVEAQATRHVLLENRKLVTKREDVRKLEVRKAKRATKRALIVVATMISRMLGTPVFSDRTEFSVTTGQAREPYHHHRIEVRIDKPGLTARTLQGYYAQQTAR